MNVDLKIEDSFCLDDEPDNSSARESSRLKTSRRDRKNTSNAVFANMNGLMRTKKTAKVWKKKTKDKSEQPPKFTQNWATAAAFLEATAPPKEYYILQARREKEENDQWEAPHAHKVREDLAKPSTLPLQDSPTTHGVAEAKSGDGGEATRFRSLQRRRRRRKPVPTSQDQSQRSRPSESSRIFTVHPGDVFIRSVKSDEKAFFKVDHVDTLRRVACDEGNNELAWSVLLDNSKFKLVLNESHVHPTEVEQAEERMSQLSASNSPYSQFSLRSRNPSICSAYSLSQPGLQDDLMSQSSDTTAAEPVLTEDVIFKHFDGGWAAKQGFFERYRMQNPYQRTSRLSSKSCDETENNEESVGEYFALMQNLANRPESAETRYMTTVSNCGIYPLPMFSDLGNPTCPSLDFQYKKISKNFLQPFCNALMGLHFLKKLDLTGNNLEPQEMSEVLKSLEKKPLLELKIGENHLGVIGCQSLGTLLNCKETAKLAVLHLARTGIGDRGLPCLAQALQSHDLIEDLDIQGNDITARGIASLSKFFEVNSSLIKLNVSWNCLGNAGLVEVCTAFSHHHNTLMKEIDFSWNGVSVEDSVACKHPQQHSKRKGSTLAVSFDVVGAIKKLLESCACLQLLNISFNRFGRMAIDDLMSFPISHQFSSGLTIAIEGNTIPLTKLKDQDKDRVKEAIAKIMEHDANHS